VSTARLFVALELPEDVRARLARWGAACAARDRALRATQPEALHVTLHFLGPRAAAELEPLAGAVLRAAERSGACRGVLDGSMWLGGSAPHVLTCAVGDRGGIAALHGALGPALAAAAPGWTPDRRALRPHVTVARVRRGARVRPGSEPPAPTGSPPFRFPALVLHRSEPGPQGPHYTTLARGRLGR
jgi:2'-5' RNA ligase